MYPLVGGREQGTRAQGTGEQGNRGTGEQGNRGTGEQGNRGTGEQGNSSNFLHLMPGRCH
ncbi:MAG: hypothetical protein EBE86_009470 [Hormoscilla sp. GUM202]|nr:hypothetical protein [Hormoscilla sp. GUM202]